MEMLCRNPFDLSPLASISEMFTDNLQVMPTPFLFRNYGKKSVANSYKQNRNPVNDIYHMANRNVRVCAVVVLGLMWTIHNL